MAIGHTPHMSESLTQPRELDAQAAYDVIASRDSRFDGRLWFGVTTTGIYCRPVCPAQTPRQENVRYFAVPAAAVSAGFRACKRCRPDSAPGSRHWDHRQDLTAQALKLIADGMVDDAGVSGLAAALHVSERHIHRMLVADVGVGPQALAQSRRAQTARLLLEQTDLTVSEIAFASGFSSLRQFNDVIKREFGSAPTSIRKVANPKLMAADPMLVLRLRFRPPYDRDLVGQFLAARAIPQVERHERDGDDWTHTRMIWLAARPAVVAVSVQDDHVLVRANNDVRDTAQLVRIIRRWLDLDADPNAINSVLGRDSILGPLTQMRPGMRVPTTVEPWETLLRAIVGQQVSVAGATTVLGRLVGAAHGTVHDDLVAFPTVTQVAALTVGDIASCGMPGARAQTISTIANQIAAGDVDLRNGDLEDLGKRLLKVRGIGPWTVDYFRMRGLGDPDAFPETDLILKQNAQRSGLVESSHKLLDRATAWRPWRAYAAHHLWNLR